MVVMRAVRDILVTQFAIGAAEDTDDVVRSHVLNAVLHRRVDDDARRYGAEVARLGLLAKRRHIETGLREQRCGGGISDPSAHGNRRRRCRSARQQAVLDRIRSDYDLPRISRRGCRVDDQHSGRAPALGFLVLIGPAPVVRHGLSAEQSWLGRGCRGIVDEHEQNLAAHISALEIVPFVFGRGGAISDEDQLAAGAARVRGRAGPHDDVIGEAEIGVSLACCCDLDGLGVGFYDVDRNALKIRAVSDSRFYAENLELGGDVFFGEPASACSRCTAFEQIGGKKAEMRVDLPGSNAGRRRG